MKQRIPTLDTYINEANTSIPREAKLLAKMLKQNKLGSGKVEPDFDLDDVWNIDNNKDLQINYNLSKNYTNQGFEIGDENGKELYMGTDVDAAFKAIRNA